MTDEDIFLKIQDRLVHARKEHPVHMQDEYGCFSAIAGEMGELIRAHRNESREREIEEALDVIATCFRFIKGEWSHDRL